MKKFLLVLLFVVALAAFVVPAAFAQAENPPAGAAFDLTGILQAAFQFVLGSAVIAAASTFFVNILKNAGFVNDSESVTWVSSINFLLIVAVFFLKLFLPDFDLKAIENVADAIVRQGPGFVLPLMPLLVAFSKWFHGAIKGTKWIGTSYSLKAGKK